ncbi:hypothetical protein LOAG_04121 [Loa loa]|uniref:Uncharacterized protein n=1 Tax=Loa loa TaxID=7209 RepID=A0A1S0U4Q9_LOALO|nr:hypothetical protein LOAG_04121 [Loa loa]EFO24364.1 hypothetical protein LOAG_04121 [Loa loa]
MTDDLQYNQFHVLWLAKKFHKKIKVATIQENLREKSLHELYIKYLWLRGYLDHRLEDYHRFLFVVNFLQNDKIGLFIACCVSFVPQGDRLALLFTREESSDNRNECKIHF